MNMLKMQSDRRSRDSTILKPPREMRFSSDLKSSARQQNSRIVKEKVIATQAKQSIKHQDKPKVKICVSQSNGDLPHELKQRANDGISFQPKTLGMENRRQQFVKFKGRKDDELVKYMSNLPGYLQSMERRENIQDNALNVGVLDWARLEKWKGNQKSTGEGDSNNASLNNCNLFSKVVESAPTSSIAVQNETPAYKSGQHPSLCSSHSSSHKNRVSPNVKRPVNNVIRFQDFESASNSSADGQKRGQWTYKSFGRNTSGAVPEKGKREDLDRKTESKVGNWSSNSTDNGILIMPKKNVGACSGAANVRVGEQQESDIERTVRISSRVGASSSKMRNHYVSVISKDQKNKKGLEELQESAINLSPQHQRGENENIVLLLPSNFSQNGFLSVPRTSLDKDLIKADSNSSSGSFHHEEEHSSELFSEIPHSCPLPVAGEANAEPHKMALTLANMQEAEQSSDASHTSSSLHEKPIAVIESEFSQNSGKGVSEDAVQTSKMLNQQTAKLAAGESRHPSPNHRFSFGLSRITRSFSSKESSALPHLSSTYASVKSGSKGDKASGHSRARSSPFRRILDPLLKSKGSNPLHSTESKQPLNGSLNSLRFKSANSVESLHNEKNEISRIHALLQLTVKNGLPLFRLVVDNNSSSSILAAPMKNLSSPGKNDSGCNYTFYTIDEIKKRSGSWINQGSKEKNHGFVYNIVAQMKVSCSSFLDLTGQNSISRSMVKEAVLFGVELREGDQASPKFMPNRELAAIVVKTPSENLTVDKKQDVEDMDWKEKGHTYGMPVNGLSNSVTAILPGGVHGLPNKGVPSPLIQRWKSGGSCDCGGWDVGCKLCVLSNENQSCKIPWTPKSCQTSDCFELFIEGEAPQDKPTFSLEPLEKGMFSIEFSSEISSLQAFFICVTVLTRHKSSDLTAHNPSEEKNFQELRNSVDGTKKNHPIFQGAAPVRYTPSPPLSPVGRV